MRWKFDSGCHKFNLKIRVNCNGSAGVLGIQSWRMFRIIEIVLLLPLFLR